MHYVHLASVVCHALHVSSVLGQVTVLSADSCVLHHQTVSSVLQAYL